MSDDADEFNNTSSDDEEEEEEDYTYEAGSDSSGNDLGSDDYTESPYFHPVLKRKVSYDVLDDEKIQARQQKLMKKLATQLAVYDSSAVLWVTYRTFKFNS